VLVKVGGSPAVTLGALQWIRLGWLARLTVYRSPRGQFTRWPVGHGCGSLVEVVPVSGVCGKLLPDSTGWRVSLARSIHEGLTVSSGRGLRLFWDQGASLGGNVARP